MVLDTLHIWCGVDSIKYYLGYPICVSYCYILPYSCSLIHLRPLCTRFCVVKLIDLHPLCTGFCFAKLIDLRPLCTGFCFVKLIDLRALCTEFCFVKLIDLRALCTGFCFVKLIDLHALCAQHAGLLNFVTSFVRFIDLCPVCSHCKLI